ncbi:MAG: serine acetyltransferase [Lachnospiraceae bacterium]|nr:serine acetyltransferase [Lachnospiraceae bacterium]
MKKLIQADLSRVYDLPLSAKERFFFPLQMKYLVLWRKAAAYRGSLRGKLLALKLERLTERTQILIPPEVTAGPGLYIGHLGRIILHPDTVLGRNVNLSTGITIGQANRGKHAGVPVIGDDVWIGTNAVIVGGIHIGNDVMIAPGAYVNFDVPDHSVVLGNPATVHPKEHATEAYINRRV